MLMERKERKQVTETSMNSFDSLDERPVPVDVTRKRGRTSSLHSREIKKKLLYSPEGKVPQIGCSHKSEDNGMVVIPAAKQIY